LTGSTLLENDEGARDVVDAALRPLMGVTLGATCESTTRTLARQRPEK
jgi:hypothetical protein